MGITQQPIEYAKSDFQCVVEDYLEEKGIIGSVWTTRNEQQAGVHPLSFTTIHINIHDVHIKMLGEVLIPGLKHIAKQREGVVIMETSPAMYRGDTREEVNISILRGARVTML